MSKPTPKGTLTNKRIDHYALSGTYGPARRQEWLDGVRRGTIRSCDHAVREGHYGPDAKRALKERESIRKRRTSSYLSDQERQAVTDYAAGIVSFEEAFSFLFPDTDSEGSGESNP